jgi:tetratricopeptide (TPR) repeat protein
MVAVAATSRPSESGHLIAASMSWRRLCVGTVALALLGGCGGLGDIRPVISMGGESIDLADPIEAGRAQLATGQYGLAIDSLTRVVQAEPRNARALSLLALGYDRIHRFDLADRYYAAALEVDPQHAMTLNNWGYSRLLRRDYAEADRLLRLASQARRDDPVIEANLRLRANAGKQPTAPTVPSVAATAAPDFVAVADHVFLMKRRAKVVRIAPGTQLLVTRPVLASVSDEGENS